MFIRTESESRKVRKFDPRRLVNPASVAVLFPVIAALVLLGLSRIFPVGLQVPAFAATLTLFMIPGLLLARLALGTCVAGAAQLPVAFVMSAGAFGLAAIPMLLLHGSLTAYLVLCGFLLAASLLGWTVLHAASPPGGNEAGRVFELPNLLWVPFLGLSGVLAYKTSVKVQRPFDDGWVYLGHVREYLAEDRLGGEDFSRISVDGWLVVQAAMSRVSGVEPIMLILEFLAPTLCVVALLALYALGRVLFESETAALLTGTLAALLLLVNPGVPLLAPGGEFVGRISEDKYAVRFIFLPVMLIAAMLFLKEQRPRSLGLFAFVCLASASVHPIGLALAVIAVGSFGIVHLAVERGRSAWRGVGGLAAVLLGVLGPPAIYLLGTGSPILSRLQSARPDTSSSILDYWQREERLLAVWDGAYVVHPSLILNPVVVAVYVVGVPFLIWRLKKSLAARLLLGVLVLAPVPIFVPFIAAAIGKIIGPWVLIRFSWPLTLAAMLTLGWACYEVLAYAGSCLERSGPAMLRGAAPLLPLVLVCVLVASSAGPVLAGLRSTDRMDETAQAEVSCHDPVFAWMGAEITTPGRVLAPEEEGSCIPAYSSPIETLGSRDGITRRSRGEIEHFYSASVVDGEMLRTLADRRIDYVLLHTNSPLTGQLEHLPGFTAMNNPGERYRLYSVDRGEPGITPVVASNSRLVGNDPEGALEGYISVLEDPRSTGDERFLAYTGLGQAYDRQGLLAEAAYSYEGASALDPEDPTPYKLASEAHGTVAPDAARSALERAVELSPRDVELRTKLGDHLLESGDIEEAVGLFREIVDAHPRVPAYRVDLGEALAVAGQPDAAGEEFGQAVYLDPLSAEVHAGIGDAHLLSDNLHEAAASYQRAGELEPESQPYIWRLGIIYSALAVEDGWGEEYFGTAEETLIRAGELEPGPGEQDHTAAVRISLGDLYRDWGREEEAREAYEEALEQDPESGAEERLEGL